MRKLFPGSAQGPFAPFADEIQNFHDYRVVRKFLCNIFHPFGERALIGKQEAIGATQIVNVLAGKTPALQADYVQA